MKPFRLKWWQWCLVGLGIIVLIGLVAPMEAPPEPAPLTDPVRFENVRDISPARSPMKFVAVVVPAGVGAIPAETAARKLCDGETHCQVLGFDDTSAKPTAMPMTDREAEALVFSYTLNRSSGHDEAVWKCPRFPGVPDGRCMAD